MDGVNVDAEIKVFKAFLYLFIVIVFGTFGLNYWEGFSFQKSLWVVIQTITTVGFGDSIPLTHGGRVFTMLLMLLGVGIGLYSVGVIVSGTVEGHLINLMGRKKMEKRISQLNNHIIVCGAGRVGQHVIHRLQKEKASFIVVDKDEEKLAEMTNENILVVVGDATMDEVLIKAGIQKAWGLVTALPIDPDNVYVTLTAKGLNPDLQVVARADRLESEHKLKRAGADKVISPSVISGRRMAISILKPTSVDYVETLMHNQDLEIEIEEVTISDKSELIGKQLKNSNIREKTGVMVIAIKRQNEIISNPSSREEIHLHDLLIVLGTREQLKVLERLATGR